MVKTKIRAGCLAAAGALSLWAPAGLFAQDAETAYAQLGCGACHGREGRGSVLAPSIATGALTPADFIAYVREPTGSMPAYDVDTVSDQTLRDMHSLLEPDTPEAALTGRVAAGAALYRRTGCYQCHANEGQGGAQGPRLGPEPLTLARLTWYVRNPSGSMPPYTDVVLSDQDLADIRAFLAARPRPPPVEHIPLLAP